jgi:predicted dehydrogenase
MLDQFELVGGVFGRDFDAGIAHAKKLQLAQERVYASVEALIDGESRLPVSERMTAVAVLTPNSSHFEIARSLLVAGFHVICEKPMTTTLSDAQALEALVRDTGQVFCVTHTYTGYPMVRQMRELIAQGLIGEIQHVDARYLQGWIAPVLKDAQKRDQTWRLDPQISGSSCCFGDIGIHAFNLVEYTTGLQIEQLLADLHARVVSNHLDIDGTALFRATSGARGVIRASQIATGEENNLTISVYGDRGALKWAQESPAELIHLPEDQPQQIYRAGNPYLQGLASASSKLPPGHPEGLYLAMANIYAGVAEAMKRGGAVGGSFPTINDGLRGVRFVMASLESNDQGQKWVYL